MEKQPIDKYGDGNCCPVCGSTRIDVCHQFPLYVNYDLKTGRERFYEGDKLVSRPSNKALAMRYKSSQIDSQMWQYICRKCNWKSEPFVP